MIDALQEKRVEVETLREGGRPVDSIELAQKLADDYEKEGRMLELSDLFGSISIAYRHLFQDTGKRDNLKLAEEAALNSIRIAQENDLKGDLARPLFNFAKVREDMGDYDGAIDSYKKAVAAFKKEHPILHDRLGVLADMEIHLFTCQYQNGDKSGLNRALRAISDLEKSGEKTGSRYNYDVWMSGAYMKLADALKKDDPRGAEEYLVMAKGIIDANPELIKRKEQWEKLQKNFL